ncbi:MAG: sigma 54-interacting transcriptional regulator [Candidatus Omnitrophica bacterium]|nr:sigma 54-interacting transcriptional regulator [Candidatus Omnitrophota bacterium]
MDKSASIFNAWKKYIDSGIEAGEVVGQVIMDSWTRCRKIGIDPYKSKIKLEPDDALKVKKESSRIFIDIIAPYINGLKANAPDMDVLIGLFDCEGKLIYIDGDKRVLEAATALGIKDGADLSEESAGTNAIAIAMKRNGPVMVLGYEHFCRDLHIFNTASTPIFNTEGGVDIILGLIALRIASNMSYLMTTLTSTAFFMQRAMRLGRISPTLEGYSRLIKEIFEESKDAVFVITKGGYIKHMNPEAIKMLAVDNYIQLKESFESLLKINPSLVKLLQEDREIPEEIPVSISTPAYSFKAIAYLKLLFSKKNEPIGAVIKFRKVSSKERFIKKAAQVKYRVEDIIGESPSMKKAIAMVKKAAETSSNVLIEGESGTGKEMFAQAIHNASDRTDQPFVVVDCASIPKELIESELFGYEAGSFTGAKKEGEEGKFEAANGGTILLDEIGDMPYEFQSRLLRVLENRTVTRIGSNKEILIDIRVIANTSKKLMEMVEKKEFRDDLYYRLSVIQIKIPSLRERPEDIFLLMDHFISYFNETMGMKVKGIEPSLKERLLLCDWPGNAREIRNMIEHAVGFGVEEEGLISWQHLSDDLRESLLYKTPKAGEVKKEDFLAEEKEKVLNSQKDIYIRAIELSKGNMSKAASILGVSRATLYRKLALLGIKK